MSKDVEKTDCRGPRRGSPALTGARPWDGRASASAGLGHGRPTWPSSPVGGLGGRPGVVYSQFDFLSLLIAWSLPLRFLQGVGMLLWSKTCQEDAFLAMKV